MRKFRTFLIVAVCAAVIAGFGTMNGAQAKEKITIGMAVSWPGYSFFELIRQNDWAPDYELEVINLNDPLGGYAMLAAGQVDIFVSTLEYTPVAVEQGHPFVQTTYTNTSYGVDHIILNAGMTPQDLKGKRVAAPTLFIGHLLMGVWLDSVGINADDVDWINLAADEAAGAMLAGDIDAGYLYEPWSTSVQENLAGAQLITTSIEPMYLKNAMFADSIYMNKEFIANRRSAAVDMMRAYWDARGHWNQNVEETNQFFADYLQWPVEDIGWVVSRNGKEIVGGLYMYDFDEAARFCGVLDGAPPFDQANGGLVQTVADTNEWWVKLGIMKTTIDANEAVDCSIMGDLVNEGYRQSFGANE